MTEQSFAGLGELLFRQGYEPLPIPRGLKGPRLQGWQSITIDADQIKKWSKEHANANIGIRTRSTPAIDIDVLDEEVALLCESVAEDLFGPLCVRIGKAPKRLLPFRADKPFRKMVLEIEDPFGQGFKIEVLGDGQQFVGYGIHPDTQKPYAWPSLASLIETPRAELPLIDPAGVLAYFDAVETALPDGWRVIARPDQQFTSSGDDDDALLSFQPKADKVSLESLRKALQHVENADDYDHWLKIGMALHHQFDGDDDGLALWHEWSADAANYDPKALDSKWEGFKDAPAHATPITARYILKHTKYREEAPVDARTALRAAIADALTGDALLDEVLAKLADEKLDAANERVLLIAVDDRHKALTGAKLGVRALGKRISALRQAKAELFDGDENEITLELELARKVLSDLREEGRHLKYFSKLWWSYRNGVWVRSDDSVIARRVMESLIALSAAKDGRVARLCARMTESRGDRLNALVSTITTMISVMVAEEGGDDPLNLSANNAPMVINCTNVELWFKADGAMKVRQHDAKHLLTNQIGCDYDENATCPTWDAALHKVFKSCLDRDEVIRHFEEVFGYILQPTRHQATWVMLKGPGGNGKSFLLNIISTLLGEHAVAGASLNEIAKGVSAHFTDSLQGKLMLLDDDLKAGTLLPDDWMKKLSEAKMISANPKFGKAYNFTARCIPVILTNAWPNTVDLSDGLRRRAQVFESDHVLSDAEKDPAHARQIRENELPGVLNRLIAGYQRFLRRGERFAPPGECVSAKDKWLSSSNPTAAFADLAFVRTTSTSDMVPALEVYECYHVWMRHWEHNARPLGRNKFYEALSKLGFTIQRVHNTTMVRSVKFTPPEGSSDFEE